MLFRLPAARSVLKKTFLVRSTETVNKVFIFLFMVHGYNEIPIKFQLRSTFEISRLCYFIESMADKLLKRRDKGWMKSF